MVRTDTVTKLSWPRAKAHQQMLKAATYDRDGAERQPTTQRKTGAMPKESARSRR